MWGDTSTLRSIVSWVEDVFFPHVCTNCGLQCGKAGPVCENCLRSLKFLRDFYCILCSIPVGLDKKTCSGCAGRVNYLSALKSVFAYDSTSKNMVLNLKFNDNLSGIPYFAEWMCVEGYCVLGLSDLLIPMPLHRWRLFHRKFNQSVLLARAVGQLCGLPLDIFTLKKNKNTEPQSNLSSRNRMKNVVSSFSVTNVDAVKGKVVTLIDDVVTTGASLQECAKVLKLAGALDVFALTLGRTMRHT